MKPEFWQERWDLDQTQWDLKKADPKLVEYWPTLNIAQGSTVFVPLCGKSMDMAWLAGVGYKVLGVELAEKACIQYFEDLQVKPTVSKNASGKFTIYGANDTQLWCGDIFDLDADDLKYVSAIFDRASVIALPPDMRKQYAEHLIPLIPSPNGILMTLDYDQSKKPGPPHAVSDAEVQELFGAWKPTLLDETVKTGMMGGLNPTERIYKFN
ncbi:putative thiopurine S-methyltransferase [Yarrowia sp. B02]|nr:putative thiopurine S-methyltransferase [Yarrowia sp. B02]